MKRDGERTGVIPDSARKKSSHYIYWWLGLIILITFITYSPTLRNGFVWDDSTDVVENQLLRTNDGLRDLWTAHWRDVSLPYYPLTFSTFWVEYHAWGLQPLGYHVVNVLLHVANAILVGILLTRLSVPGAWLAALIFAVHPVQVESVAWIAERKNVLSGCLFFLAFLAYLKFLASAARRWWFYGAALALYLLALLAKTAVVPLPAVLLVVLWWKREKIRREDLVPLAPFFLVGATMGIVTMHFQAALSNTQAPEWHLSIIQRVLLAGRALWFYAGKIIWPHPVMIVYPQWQIDPSMWWQYLYPACALGVILALWLNRAKLGKGPLAAVLCFAVMLGPVLGFLSVGFAESFVMDHWQYLASIGLIALGSACATQLIREKSLGLFAAAIVVAVLCTWSWRHCEAFRSQETLYSEEVTLNPGSWSGHYNLGNAYLRARRLQDAIDQYEQTLQIRPDYEEAEGNLGYALLQSGNVTGAIAHLKHAVEIDPRLAEGCFNLGAALLQSGQIQEATEHLRKAVQLKPEFTEARYMLAAALAKQGHLDEAISQMEKAVQLRPDSDQFRQTLENMRQFRAHSVAR